MTITLAADGRAAGRPLAHYWSACVGAGRAHEGLRANWQEHLGQAVRSCGFRYVRFHGLFHDDMFVLRDMPVNQGMGETGGRYLNFQYVDELFDRLLDIGIRPFVEFGFCPGDLATKKATCFWWGAHGSPPNDLAAWSGLISRCVQHWLDRYGADEVRRWYFEVWNEPNLPFFFSGGYSDYLALYEATVGAVKDCDPALRVGGPATSNFVCDGRFDGEREGDKARGAYLTEDSVDAQDWQPVWVERFLAWAGDRGLPVDFVSTHPYPTEWGFFGPEGKRCERGLTRYCHSTRDDLRRLVDIVRASPFPVAEIHCTEWSSSPHCRDHSHDAMPAAAYIIQAVLGAKGLVDSLSYWTFTDVFEEFGAGHTCFHGGFGMISFQGVVKPSFHAYRMLNCLGMVELASAEGAIATRTADGRLSALAWNYPSQRTPPTSLVRAEALAFQKEGGGEADLDLCLVGLKPGATFDLEILAPGQGDALAAWMAMGSPEPPTRGQIATLRERAWTTLREPLVADHDGRCLLRRRLPAWSVAALVERPSA